MTAARRSRAWTGVLIALALGLAALPLVANDYLLATGLGLLMWLAMTQSWCVLSKMTGYVSLGHVVFYGLGAYVVVVTWQRWPLALAVLAGGAVAALFAAATAQARAARPANRPRGKSSSAPTNTP